MFSFDLCATVFAFGVPDLRARYLLKFSIGENKLHSLHGIVVHNVESGYRNYATDLMQNYPLNYLTSKYLFLYVDKIASDKVNP